MTRPSRHLKLRLLMVALAYLPSAAARGIAVEKVERLDLQGDDILEVAANPQAGFNFPYYVFLPGVIDKGSEVRLLVEPNNTGTATDDFEVHRQRARQAVESSYPNLLARALRVPLLVPVFPRPRTGWQAYTHQLDRDTLEIDEGPLKRLDLQLAAMIDHATELLSTNGFKLRDQVFMNGFSASAKFCNRFAFLHPERVKAVATGGVNGLPTLPIASRNGQTLPFPIGIADIERFTGRAYDAEAHRRVAQYVYMGGLDRNDTLPYRDAWSEDEANVIKSAIAEKMMPDRWAITQAIYREELPRAQCVTYNGVGHTITPEMGLDLVKFFKANSGDAFATIEPHTYPFVEYKEHREMHVEAVYAKGDKRLPDRMAGRVREGTFLLGVKEWFPEQDYKQLDEFVENAGFNFRLRAEGHLDIVITRRNWQGNTSSGRGAFQAQYLALNDDQLKTLARGVPYTLHAENENDEYVWIVEDGVTLTRPLAHSEIVRAESDGSLQVAVKPRSLRVRAFIDGSDTINVRGNELWYEHHTYDLPGTWNGRFDEPTYINGEPWKPEWNGNVSSPFQDLLPVFPKVTASRIRLTKLAGRGPVSISQSPSRDNRYTLSVFLDDDQPGGAEWYEILIEW